MVGTFWLANSSTEEKWDQLQGEVLDQKLSTIDEKELSQWYFWKEGMTDWEPITNHKELHKHYEGLRAKLKPKSPPPFKAPSAPPPFAASPVQSTTAKLPNEPVKEVETFEIATFQVVNTEAIADDKVKSVVHAAPRQSGEERRKHQRFNKRFKVLIESGTTIFRSFTQDISLGGIALTQSLPEKMLSEECTLYITFSDNKDTVMVKAKPIIREKSNYKFFSFTEMNDFYKAKLEEWLSDKIKKKAA